MANGLYDSNGSIRTTTVSGAVWTGLQAPDGSINIVINDTGHFGVYHPCGAWRVSTASGRGYDPSGAYYLSTLLGNAVVPSSPSGYVLIIDTDGNFITDADGAFLLEAA